MTPSRRALLASGAGLIGTVLAGCLGGGDDGTANNSTSPGSVPVPDDSPVADVEVTTTDVVVSLEPDSDVSRLNLIAPDGTAFARRTVTAGATTVRLPIIEHGEETFWGARYSPGTHELVAIHDGETERIAVPLEPDVRVRAVEPVYDDEDSIPTGNLELTLENIGTGPTWVYQIAYDDSPSGRADYSLGEIRDSPNLTAPSEVEETTLAGGEAKTYIGGVAPLRYRNLEGPPCTSTPVEFRMMVGLGLGDPIDIDLTVRLSGEEVNGPGYRLCRHVDVEFNRIGGSSWD
ncbi:hypothetical protein [Haloarchaeobius baliensis]|uniref:hypothetical protein n=1 Tax=Haloarchaeobius baliensis TaxID=1670458 RepID=UPI003F8841FE